MKSFPSNLFPQSEQELNDMEDDILVVESTEESTSSSETDSTVSDGNLTEGLKEAVGNSFGSTLERSSPDNKVLERKNVS